MDELLSMWQQYQLTGHFNVHDLPPELLKQGTKLSFQPKQTVVSRGDFPSDVYFVLSGEAVGLREYADGNEYSYFQLDENKGVVGLLEVIAQKEHAIATVIAKTPLEVLRLPAVTIYRRLQTDVDLMRKCMAWLAQDLYTRSGNDGLFYYAKAIDRVRFYLVTYYEQKSHLLATTKENELVVAASYQEIAKQLGISVRTVGRVIQKLRLADEVSTDKKKIFLSPHQYKQMLLKIEF